MEQNFQTTKAPGTAANVGPGYPPNASWSNPNNIKVDDANSASIGFFEGGQGGDDLVASNFGFGLPDFAKVDGIAVRVDGSNIGSYGTIYFGTDLFLNGKDVGALNQTYGGATDLWGQDEITPADLNDSAWSVNISLNDVSGGDGIASVEYVEVTVYWHVDLAVAPADVPTRVAYKMYSRNGNFLGEIPVTSPFGFAQDKDSAGSTLALECAADIDTVVPTEALQTEDDLDLQTEDGQLLLATLPNTVARGADEEEALYKNSNRLKVWMYNYWYPNGKLMFSGQVNRVSFQFGGKGGVINLTVLSDGLDLTNFIARGFPFTYTNDVSQTSQNGFVTVVQDGMGAGWTRFGQTVVTGGSTTNIGAISLMLQGTANVTVSMYDAPNGNFIASVTRSIADGSATVEQFNFPQLVSVPSNTSRFYAISVDTGQSINVYKHGTSSTYANGSLYESDYAGGSGGGSYFAISGDLYFVTKYGTPTTTTTYSTQDPVTGMAHGILADYNSRGGYITERNFVAAGYNLTYTFNLATIYDAAVKKVLELSPTGYYSYIDLGTAEMDIMPMSDTADFTIVRGKDVATLNLSLTIEQVKNYLLVVGGETAGVNLFRQYQDTQSSGNYGTRMATKSDNRVTVTGTADAIGNTYIDENADEAQETTVTIPMTAMDITQLTPGKTIGFRNFGSFIDAMVLQIVRREFNLKSVTLTLGRLPIRMNDEVQRINRELLNEQTIKNPTQPS